MFRKIGVMTSGGDSPGMNPAVRAVVRTAASKGVKVVGIRNGYEGLYTGDLVSLDDRSMSSILERGGTILQSSRCKQFYTPEGRAEALDNVGSYGIGGLIVIGGDGSLTGARELSRMGLPTMGIPGSIDNDLYGTDMCIGADTAANTIMQMIDKIKDTARSHRRCFLVEVMGRSSGYLALTTAISAGAEIAVIPEYRVNVPRVLEVLHDRAESSRDNSIIVLAEGVCEAHTFEKWLHESTGDREIRQEVRKTVLGHVQRGGVPTHFDRLLASRMGELAVMSLLQGETGSMVALQKSRVTVVDFDSVLGRKKHPAPELIRLARNLNIEFGDVVEAA
ncbi:MAG: 6-phosphofructokinase [Chthoniobacterales bacterium]